MTMAKVYRNNHSRYLDYGAKKCAEMEYERLRVAPTAKQKKFFVSLIMRCKDNGIEPDLGYPVKTRGDYMSAISTLVEKLESHGVEIHTGNKSAERVLIVSDDSVKERIIVHD